MTYTNTWSTTRPLGSAQANTADDEMRAIRLDVQERMNELVEDWSADPVVPKQSVYGTKEGKTMMVHGTAFVIEPAETNSFNYADNGVTNVASDAQPIRAWLPMANGVTITKIEWLVTNGDTAAMSMILGSVQFEEAVAVTTHNSLSTTISGTVIVDSGPVAISVGADNAFFLKADKGGGAAFAVHAVRITYNAPDGRNTL